MRYIKIEDLLKIRSRWGQGNELWKNRVLKEDFRNFFYNKCWYTEVPLIGQDVHIDHFRPKAAVKPFKHFKYNHLIKTFPTFRTIARQSENTVSFDLYQIFAFHQEKKPHFKLFLASYIVSAGIFLCKIYHKNMYYIVRICYNRTIYRRYFYGSSGRNQSSSKTCQYDC